MPAKNSQWNFWLLTNMGILILIAAFEISYIRVCAQRKNCKKKYIEKCCYRPLFSKISQVVEASIFWVVKKCEHNVNQSRGNWNNFQMNQWITTLEFLFPISSLDPNTAVELFHKALQVCFFNDRCTKIHLLLISLFRDKSWRTVGSYCDTSWRHAAAFAGFWCQSCNSQAFLLAPE